MQQVHRNPQALPRTTPLAAALGGLALPAVIWRRLLSHLGLVLTVLAGVALAVGIVVSIPVYAEAAGYRILLNALVEERREGDTLPPFAMVYKYGGARDEAISWAHYKQADDLAGRLAASVALPTTRSVRYAATEKLRLLFPDGQGKEVMYARLAFQTGLREQIRIVDGAWPAPWDGSGPIDVLVADATANKNTILVDDVYRLQVSGRGQSLDLPIRVAGLWQPLNPESDYWFNPPSALSDQIIVEENMFAAIVDVPEQKWVSYAAWYTALDGTSVRSANVSGLVDRINTVTADLQQGLPGAILDRSPSPALERHKEQVRLLTVTLALFSVPLLCLIGYFVVQVAGIIVQRQQQEVAVLRSRGSSRAQVLTLALGEGVLLAVGALLIGLPLGVLLAQAISWTQSFLHFAPLPGPQPELLPVSWQHGAVAAALVIPAMMVPALGASKQTIVSFKQERARDMRPPLWQRMLLDVLLLIPALYGYQQLRLSGMIGIPGVALSADDPFSNPILLLAPALMIFALALLALRFLPGLLSLLAWVLGRLPGVALVTALRFLARTPRAYGGPVLLIMLTLSLATFTASMARTLDEHSVDRALYRAGADVRFVSTAATLISGGSMRDLPLDLLATLSDSSAPVSGEVTQELSEDYFYIPIEDYLTIPGVTAATRVGLSRVDIAAGGGSPVDGLFYGVDRATLAPVVSDSWRADYAQETLGAALNRLADSPQAALVSARFARERGLRIGDTFTLEMNDRGERQQVPFTMAGTLDYFPTLYPEEQPFIIGNLDYSFDSQGGPYKFEVWMDLAPDASLQRVEAASLSYGMRAIRATPQRLIELDALRPERQGLFGLLSVGFLATALVTVIGFLTYTMFSFQRRLVELGVLRAMGLGTRQLALLLVSEQTLVIGIATLLGTAFGLLTSTMFVPFLQVRTGAFPDTPPFLVHIAWDQIAVVCGIAAGMLAVTVLTTLALLRRMRIFEAVKLGEAV